MPKLIVMTALFTSTCLLPLMLGCSTASEKAATSPTQEQIADLTLCPEPRPELCAQIYQPVCAETSDGQPKTYASGCMACTDPKVIGYRDGECPTGQ